MNLAVLLVASSLIAPAVAAPAMTQSINIDFGFTLNASVDTPPNTSGAAAGQTGHWNLVNPFEAPVQLGGLDGLPTGVTAMGNFMSIAQLPNLPTPSGADGALMNDFTATDFQADNTTTWTLEGLRPARYAVYTYAMDAYTFMPPVEIIVSGSSSGPQFVDGPWPGSHAEGVTYALHEINLFSGPLQITAQTDGGFLTRAVMNGIQLVELGPPLVGSSYCATELNSTGAPGELFAIGNPAAAANDLTLNAESLPVLSFGFFLTSPTQTFISNPGSSAGNLCVGPSVGRYVGPGQIQSSGLTGTISLDLDLTQHPTPNGLVTVQAGQTWNFQAWFRDAAAGAGVSNFTNGLEVPFE